MDARTYAEKLKDPRWQKRRLQILERDKFTCLMCGAKDKTLEVHHLQYFGEPWDAPDEALETLCCVCHDARPKIDQAITSRLNLIPTADVFLILKCLSPKEATQSDRLWAAKAFGAALRNGLNASLIKQYEDAH